MLEKFALPTGRQACIKKKLMQKISTQIYELNH